MNYSVTGFEMILQRKMSFYIVTYYLPSGLFVVVSWISFLVNPEVIPGRMTLLVTIFLVLINIFNTIQTNSPKAEGLTGKYIRLCRHSAPDSLYFVHCGILKLSYFNKYLQNDPIQPWFWNACESSIHNTQHLYKTQKLLINDQNDLLTHKLSWEPWEHASGNFLGLLFVSFALRWIFGWWMIWSLTMSFWKMQNTSCWKKTQLLMHPKFRLLFCRIDTKHK